MTMRLVNAPFWVVALVNGAVFGVLFGGLWVLLQDPGVVPGVLTPLVAALFFGPLTALANRPQRERLRAVVGDDPVPHRQAAQRAVTLGTVPADPAARAVAARLLRFTLAEHQRSQLLLLIGPYVVAVLLASLATSVDPVWWGGVAVSVGVAVWVQRRPQVLERRLERVERA